MALVTRFANFRSKVQTSINHQNKKMKTLKIKITLLEELLGTASANPEVQREYIASKAADAATIEDEVAAIGVDAAVAKSMTIFPRENGKPILYDYQFKGFFKDSCGALWRVPGTLSNKTKAYKKIIDGTMFVQPRKIHFNVNGKIGNCQRPLRAETAQGPRVALANSETIPAGSSFVVEIVLLDEGLEKLLIEWLDYGKLRGLGQWRNSGKGRFDWKEV